ncbi:MAG: hypothetical protein L6R42_000419 [Xanthoria sp. 1 TBL-2021]|nr:MAG: hypothetical protein L6R42_000419 [Xanthoria sp. 1 TBL-2021]
MSGLPKLHLLEDSLDRRVVAFPNYVEWQLINKISEKAWEGSDEDERKRNASWQPDEAHAIYECLTINDRVPHNLPPKNDPRERANDASGLRLNYATKNEIKVLQILTATNCSATPRLLGYKIDVQDDSVLNSHGKPRFEAAWGRSKKWWMPGGYIVYILMAKLQAEPLDINTFWNENLFPSQKRAEVRARFQESYMLVQSDHVLSYTYNLAGSSEALVFCMVIPNWRI